MSNMSRNNRIGGPRRRTTRMTEEEARKHWEGVGKEENRTFHKRGDLYL